MDELVHLDHPGTVEVRSLEKRELHGRFVPYGEEIQVRGRPESFTKGAFAGVDPKKARLLHMHDQTKVIGKMTELEEREDGAYATFKVANTALGNEVLQLASEGMLDSFSAGFIPGEQTQAGVHTRVKALPEVSIVTWGAYDSAKVLSVRDTTVPKEEHNIMTDKTNTVEAAEVPNLDALESRMEDMQSAVARLEAYAKAPETRSKVTLPTPFDYFVAELQAEVLGKTEKRERLAEQWAAIEQRDLANVVGTLGGASTTASGLVQDAYIASQLVNVLDARRPIMRNAGSFPMPASGYAKIPVVTQNTNVGVRATQLGNATSRELRVVNTDFSAKWYSGAVEIALELIQTSDPSVLGLVWEDLLGMFAQVTEAAAITDIEAANFTYFDDTLAVNTYAAFATDVATAAIDVRNATGAPATKLAIPYATWPAVITFVDANDRRQFTSGDHSDGNVSLTAEQFSLPGGIDVFAAGVTAPILFNEQALKVATDGPTRVEATHVETMARQVGLLGRTMIVPRIAGGIIVFAVEPSSSS